MNLRGFIETEDLLLACTNALALDGRVVHYTVSKTSPMFGDEAFNKIFHSKCFGEYNPDTIGVDYLPVHVKMRIFVALSSTKTGVAFKN